MALVYDDEPTSSSSKLAYDDDEKSIGGFAQNAVSDVGGIAKGLGSMAKTVSDVINPWNVTMHPRETGEKALGMVTGVGKGLLEEGKRLGGEKLLQGDFPGAGRQFVNAAYNKPVTTALDVLPVVQGVGKLAGLGRGAEMAAAGAETATVAPEVASAGKVAGTGLADDFSRVAEAAPNPMQVPGEAADILKQAGAPKPPPPAPESVPLGSTFQETVQNLTNKIPGAVKKPLEEVQDFLTQKYGQAAAKPGFGETLGDIALRKAQSMRFREMGAAPGQIRKLLDRFGEDKVRALSDLAEEKGITEPVIGYKIGQNIENLEKSSGQAIGGIREIAAKRGAAHNIDSLIQSIKQELDPVYLGKGTASGQKGAYLKALNDIKAAGKNPVSLAKAITNLNDYASKNKMTQATGAMSDVANSASKINNNLIQKFLSPQEAQLYKDSLRDFGASQIYKKFYGFRAGRELAGRSGPGGILRNIKQAAMDAGGNKLLEKSLDKFGRKLKANPGMAKDFGTLSQEALSDILSSLDEVIDETVK